VAIVTISRQYGAGGRRVGPALATALGHRFVDREVAEEAARRLGVSPEVATGRDERAPAIMEAIGLALAAASPEFAHAPPPDLDDRALAEATRRVIESLADVGGFVILGRGGQAILERRRDACHLSLVGDVADRAARIMEWQGVDEREAVARCERADAERAGYLRHFYGRDIRDPLLYHAVINTSRLEVDGAVEVALAAAHRAFGIAPTG
jgi:cytidylate kinase